MIEKLNSKIRPLLEIYDSLKDKLKIEIKTPKIATCGMQSHGKTSTLKSITKIDLLTKAETYTICPIKICLKELKKNSKEKPYYSIKIEDEDIIENDKHIEDFKTLKDKINEYQEKVKKECELKDQNITEEKNIKLDIYKKNVPNLNLYDLPGFAKGNEEEVERIYETFLNDEETIVLLVLNSLDNFDKIYVTEFMKKINNYQNKIIPIVAKADLITNFGEKYKQLNRMNLKNTPCLIINKNQMLNLTYNDEVKKIKEIIPNVEKYEVNIGRKNLINEIIKKQYELYKENFKDIIETIKKEIKINKDKLEKLPKDYDLKEDFFDSFVDKFEELLNIFNEKIKNYKKGPQGTLLKYEIHEEYENYIKKSKEKVNDFLSKEFCDYVTNNIEQTNSDKITILEDDVPFKLLITPKIKEILSVFEEIIGKIYEKIINKINNNITDSFGKYKNLENKIKDIYKEFTAIHYEKIKKFYEEICLLEIKNISTFDLELNYKCHVLVRKILHFLYKKIKQPDEEEENKDDVNVICDYRDDIVKGIKTINDFTIKKFKKLTEEIIENLYNEVKNNSHFVGDVEKKQLEYKSHIKQIIGIINNYEVEELTRIYDTLGCKGRPKLSYNPENAPTFEERIENINKNVNDEDEFIPGFQFIKNKNLNNFIDLYKSEKVIPKTANVIIKMVSYAEVMCNRVIDIIFLSIQNYLYDNLTNSEMINHIRNKVHKLLYRMNIEECKSLLEDNKQIEEEIKTCKNNIEKLTSYLKDIEIAHNKFYDNDIEEIEENEEEEEEEKQIIENKDKKDEKKEIILEKPESKPIEKINNLPEEPKNNDQPQIPLNKREDNPNDFLMRDFNIDGVEEKK